MVHYRAISLFRMHDEHADHALHFLHRSMGVIKERPCLMQIEFINKLLAGRDRFLADIRSAVHLERNFESMPMHGSGFRETILKNDPHTVTLGDLNSRPRNRAVVAPGRDRLEW